MANNIISATQQVEKLNDVFNQHTIAIEKSVDQLEKLNAQYTIVPGDFIRNQREIAKLETDQARARTALKREIVANERAIQAETRSRIESKREIVANERAIQAEARSRIESKREIVANERAIQAEARSRAALKREIVDNERAIQAEARTRITSNREKQSEIRLQEAQARQTNRVNREREREARLLARNQGIYNRVQRVIKNLTIEYNDLSVRKRLFNSLTDVEEGRLQSLQTRLTRYLNVLKQTDANIGKFQRSVGDYSSSWNGLGNALNQLTREAPAFANSLEIGFLAISNNLPILVDEINRLTLANKALAAQGKPVTSVIRQISSALISWQSLISVGVTLLTLYGAELVEWVRSLFAVEEQIDDVVTMQERLNDLQEDAAQSISKEIAELNFLSKSLNNANIPLEKREQALNRLKELYPDYFENLSLEKDSYNDISTAVRGATDELVRQALAKAIIQEIQEVEATRLKTIIETERKLRDLNQAREENNAALEIATEEFRILNTFANEHGEEITKNTATQARANNEARRLTERITTLRQTQSELTSEINSTRRERERANREANNEISLLTNISSLQDVFNLLLDDNTKKRAKNITVLEGSLKFQRQLIESLIEEREGLAVNTEEYREYTAQIAEARDVLKELEALLTGFVSPDLQIDDFAIPETDLGLAVPSPDEIREALQVLVREAQLAYGQMSQSAELSAEAQKEIFETLFNSFSRMYNIDLRAFTNLVGNKEATTADYVDAAVEASNFILNATRENFQLEIDAQREMLEQVLNNENASEEQKQIARKRFEERERQIRIKAARAEREAALIQVAIDTAAAIVKTLSITGFLAGLPLIATIAAIGAAQAAFIAAQPLPQFEQGTQDAPMGWAITQEKRPEPITDKKGNIKTMGLKGGPKYTWLEKGDKVYKSMDDFLSKNPVNEAMFMASQETNQHLKLSDGMIMLDYAFATIKEDIIKGSQKGVENGLKKFKVINNNKIDLGHQLWKKNKGYV